MKVGIRDIVNVEGEPGSRRLADRAEASSEVLAGARGLGRLTIPLDERSLRAAMRTVLLAPMIATGSVALATGESLDLGPLRLALVAAAIVAAAATALPWPRLLARGWGMGALLGWALLNVLLVTAGIWAAGGERSELMVLYALTTVFSAAVFTPRHHALLLAFTVAAYGAVLGLTTQDPLPLVVLAILAILSNVLVREVKRQMVGHLEAKRESDRRWSLLAAVSAAAREMSDAEPPDVLRVVVDAVCALGYPAAWIYVYAQGPEGELVIEPSTADSREETTHPRHLLDEVRILRETVVVADRAGTNEELGHLGLRAAVGVPIVVEGVVSAALVVGSSGQEPPPDEDVEVFRLLASQAGQAVRPGPGEPVPSSGPVTISLEGDPPTARRVLDLTAERVEGGLHGGRFESVLTAAKAGMEWPITALYREFHPRVQRYLWAREPGESGTIATLVWGDVAAGLAEFAGDERDFRRWVFGLARTRVLEHSAERSVGAEASSDSSTDDGSDALARIAALPPDQADAVLLHALGELDVDDMASITGQEPGLVHALKDEGLRRLRIGTPPPEDPEER